MRIPTLPIAYGNFLFILVMRFWRCINTLLDEFLPPAWKIIVHWSNPVLYSRKLWWMFTKEQSADVNTHHCSTKLKRMIVLVYNTQVNNKPEITFNPHKQKTRARGSDLGGKGYRSLSSHSVRRSKALFSSVVWTNWWYSRTGIRRTISRTLHVKT